ncbi:MAG: hypothetical protein QNJ72_24485 [Pleurocapsa sp. MO_226.B13]|nr:hypothetical protein [Pleurocapsa sp. MO_226.B13]
MYLQLKTIAPAGQRQDVVVVLSRSLIEFYSKQSIYEAIDRLIPE